MVRILPGGSSARRCRVRASRTTAFGRRFPQRQCIEGIRQPGLPGNPGSPANESEVYREVQAHEPRRVDRDWRAPAARTRRIVGAAQRRRASLCDDRWSHASRSAGARRSGTRSPRGAGGKWRSQEAPGSPLPLQQQVISPITRACRGRQQQQRTLHTLRLA
jgi:hypothetical protein